MSTEDSDVRVKPKIPEPMTISARSGGHDEASCPLAISDLVGDPCRHESAKFRALTMAMFMAALTRSASGEYIPSGIQQLLGGITINIVPCHRNVVKQRWHFSIRGKSACSARRATMESKVASEINRYPSDGIPAKASQAFNHFQ